MTNRETMPGTTGKIPKNADNKNGSSRARSPSVSRVCPALVVTGARWRRSSSGVGVGVVVDAGVGLRDDVLVVAGRRRHHRRHRQRRVGSRGSSGW